MAFERQPASGFISPTAMAKRLGIARMTLYRWMEAGCPSHQPMPGGRRLMDPVEVDEWIRLRCTSPAPDQKAAG